MPGPLRNVVAVRKKLKSHSVINRVYVVTVGIIGVLVVLLGLVLVPFPGPGWLIVIIGLIILASEFAWAEGLLDFVRDRVRRWTEWITRQSWPIRLGLGLLTAAFVGAVLYATMVVIGVPDWVPSRLVPPLPGLQETSAWR